jgi:UPF0271 protein
VTGRALDVNADVGEGLDDEALMPHLTSVSIACGGHTGDRETMARAVDAALRHGLLIGAHPSYPDREGFGRRPLAMPAGSLVASLAAQLTTLAAVATELGARLDHVKAHGALYNQAWGDLGTAEAVVRAAGLALPGAALFCPPGSVQAEAAAAIGMDWVAEGFADRAYGPAGHLLPRDVPGAVLDGAADLDRQLAYLVGMPIRTVCVHGDNPAALEIARALPAAAARAGLVIRGYRAPR